MLVAKGPNTVDFFDEDDEPQRGSRQPAGRPAPAGGAGSGGPPTRQQARARQAALAVGAILVLILIVVAFRGCLNARAERGFQNYVSDLSSITTETDQLSQGFFGRFGDEQGGSGDSGAGEDVSEISLDAEVNTDTGTAQSLLERAENLDSPDEVEAAQEQIVLSYELRHDALEGIAAQLGKALGNNNSGAKKANQAIYTQMRVLSASDILYARARDQIEQTLEDKEIVVDDGVPRSQFLPDEPDYLDPSVTDSAIAALGGSSSGASSNADCDSEDVSHGLAISTATPPTLNPSGTALSADAPVTATADDNELEVSVENQGESDESNIDVSVSGGGIQGSSPLNSIAAGETQSVTIPLRPAPSAGETVDLEVEVATVPCEQVDTNNSATYSVTFG